VSPLLCPPQTQRRTFNFNIEISESFRVMMANRLTERLYHKIEAPLYRSIFKMPGADPTPGDA